jgi:hypothetical protein
MNQCNGSGGMRMRKRINTILTWSLKKSLSRLLILDKETRRMKFKEHIVMFGKMMD